MSSEERKKEGKSIQSFINVSKRKEKKSYTKLIVLVLLALGKFFVLSHEKPKDKKKKKRKRKNNFLYTL